jgi:neutral ceramidase
MKIKIYHGLLFFAIVIFAIACSTPTAKIKVGVGESIITPPDPVGVPMAGYDRGGHNSTGVHDELYARSIVVEGEDGTSVAMITLALVNLSEQIMDSIRSGVNRETGIPFKNVIISATHTHSGPELGGIDDEYVQFLIRNSVNSASDAWKSRVPGKIGVGSVDVFGLAMNDRRMEFGGIPADPEAAVIKIERANGSLMGVFFNYGCHPSVLDLHNLEFTEDWPYYSIKGIKEKLEPGVVVGYFQSAQGDAKVGYNAELSAVGAYMQDLRSFEFAERKGNIMTEAVLKLLPTIETTDDIPVRVSYDKFAVPRRTTFPFTQAEALSWQERARKTLEEKEKLVLEYPRDTEGANRLREASLKAAIEGKADNYIGPRTLDRYKVDLWLATQAVGQAKRIEEQPEDAGPFMMPMQAVRLGKNVFVTFPAEVFTEIGLAVKQLSPYENTFIFGVAGGYRGYIATAAEFIEGGYAVNGSPYAPEAEKVIIDSSVELISRVED